MYRLAFDDDGGARRSLPLTAEVTVGRSGDGNAIRLGARNVSRHHARFTVVNGAPFVEDSGSRNGTFVNGVRLRARRRLRDGDVVRVGDHALLVEMWTCDETQEVTPEAAALAAPLPPRTTPPPQDANESTLAVPAQPPRPGRLRDTLAKAIRALSGREEP